ncbi:MAG: hypothetical protein ABIH36_01825 [bacterium]
MFRLSPRMVRRIRLLGITVAVIAGLVVAQAFLWQMVRSMTVRFQEKRSQIQQVAELKSRIEITESNYKKQRASLDQLTAVVPFNRDTIQVLERLESVANQMSMEIDVVGIVEGEPLWSAGGGAAVFPLTVSVTTSGKPSQLLDYVEEMEYVQELVQVQSFAITAGNGDLFNLDMAVTFYLQQKDNGGK